MFRKIKKNHGNNLVGNKSPIDPQCKLVLKKILLKDNNVDLEFEQNDRIWYRNEFKNIVKWIKATVIARQSQVTFLIEVNGALRLAHRNQ